MNRLVWKVVGLVVFWAQPLVADNWPSWRGPRGDGISRDASAPLEWSPTKSVIWKTKIPGRGHGSPIVWEDAIFLLSADEETQNRLLLRVDRVSGAIAWQRTVINAPLEKIHRLNSYASSTPATDGERVFVTFLDGDRMYVAAYDFAGQRIWEQRPGPFSSVHGYCCCPVLYKDSVILNGDHDGDSFLVRLRKEDGSVVWKTPRDKRTRSYSTPIVVAIDGRDQIVLTGDRMTAGYDAATGKQVWRCDGPSEQMVATMVERNHLLFALGGYPDRHLLAIRKGGKGDVTGTHIAWKHSDAIPYVPSPLLYGDYLHVISDEGIYTCFDPEKGTVHAQARLMKHTSSSIVGACGRVYITDDTGTTVVLANGPDRKVLARNRIGEDCYTTPALAHGEMFIRGAEHLFHIGTDGPGAVGD